jgi:hypothetical protein
MKTIIKLIKITLFLLFIITIALYYIIYTPSGRNFAYNVLGFILTQKVHLHTKVTDINLTDYPYMKASLLVEDMYELNIDGYYRNRRYDMHYTLNSHCIKSDICKIKSDVAIEGNFKGTKKHIRITGAGVALDGNISYTGIKERHAFRNIDIDIQEINSTKLFKLLGQKAEFNGKANAFIHFDTLSSDIRKGALSYAVKDKDYHGLDVDFKTHIDIKNEKHTFTMHLKTPTASLSLINGKYNQKKREASALYIMDIDNVDDLKKFLKIQYTGPFYSMGQLEYRHKKLALQGFSRSLGGWLDLRLKENKLHFYLHHTPLSPLLTRLHTEPILDTNITGKGVYDLREKKLTFDANLDRVQFKESKLTRSILDKQHIDLTKEIFDHNHIHIRNIDKKIFTDLYLNNQTNHLHFVNTYFNSENNSIQSYVDLKMQKYYLKGDLFLKIDKYTAIHDTYLKFRGTMQRHYNVTLKGLINSEWTSMDYNIHAKRLPSPYCTIVDDINITGHINGSQKRLHIAGYGTAMNGKVKFDGMKVGTRYEDIHIKLSNIHAKKLSTLLNHPELPSGKVDATVDFKTLSPKKQKGYIHYLLTKSKIYTLPLRLDATVKIDNHKQTFTANVELSNATIDFTKGFHNNDTNETRAFYTLNVKKLQTFKPLLGYAYHGSFYAMGEVSYKKKINLHGLSKSLGGMTEYHYDEQTLNINLEHTSLKDIMNLLDYPSLLDAETNGTIVYHFPKKILQVKTRLNHTKFLHTDIVNTVYKKSGVNLLKEHFNNALLEATFKNHIVLGNLIMNRGKSHLSLTNTRIDTQNHTINAYFDVNMQKQAFSGKVYGDLRDPKVNLDMQKLIRHEMDKQLDSFMGESNRKLMQNMPMGGVAEDMASGMGGAFMGMFF